MLLSLRVFVILIHLRHRFMMVPRPTMEKELKAEEKELTDDINSLNKKVSLVFLQGQFKLMLSGAV